MTTTGHDRRRPRTRVEYNVSTLGLIPSDVVEKVSQAHAKAILTTGTFAGDPGRPVVKSARHSASASDETDQRHSSAKEDSEVE